MTKMTKAQLERRIGVLESINDQLISEVEYVDHLMKEMGFKEGITTIKATAQEIIDSGILEE